MGDKLATATTAITGNGGERVAVTEENLPRMKNVVIMQNEGIVYCPVAKARKNVGGENSELLLLLRRHEQATTACFAGVFHELK